MLRAPTGEEGTLPSIIDKDRGARGNSTGGKPEDEGKQNEAPRR
jgi:hypothetical protein